MKVTIDVSPELAQVQVTVEDGDQTLATRSETGEGCGDRATRFARDVIERMSEDGRTHIVVVPRTRWQHGGRTRGSMHLLSRSTGRLCALGWACLSLGVPEHLMAGADNLNELQAKLRTQGLEVPERLQPLLDDLDTQNALLDGNDAVGQLLGAGSYPPPASRRACARSR